MALSVADSLALPVLRRGVPELVAAADRADRPIRWVHTAEVANIAGLLKGGELLLTTGLGLGTSAPRQRAAVRRLAARDVAGIVLELGTVFEEAPAALVEACTANRLPLAVLHRQVRFVEVTETIHAEIVNSQFALMNRGEELHRSFTDLMLRGAGVPDVLQALAEATGNPVRLLRDGGTVAAEARGDAAPADLEAAWDAHARGLAGAPATLQRPIPSGDPGRPHGTLALLELAAPFDDFSAVALERAVPLVGLALTQHGVDEALVHRERGALIEDLLHGALDEAQATARAAALGFRAEVMVPVAMARRAPRLGRLTADEDARWTLLWREVRRELESRRTPALVGGVGERSVLVVGLRDREERAAAVDRAARLVRTVAERQLGSPASVIICAGRQASSWSDLAAALDQALATVPPAAELGDRTWHDAAAPDVDRLLATLREQRALQEFVEARIGPVLASERERPGVLLETLEAYCANGGRKAAAAQALGLARPSLYHRLERLERLLGASLTDPDTLFEVQLALRARRQQAR